MTGTARHAIVIGAGVAGLAAAAALARHCDRVTLVERDPLPGQPAARRGVPQSDQLHNILGRGSRHLEEMLPGFRDGLLAAGGIESRVGEQVHLYDVGHRLPSRDVGLTIMSAWRPAIEHVARGVLAELSNVDVRDQTKVGRLVEDDGAVIGVVVSGRRADRELRADLVVDATGINALGVQTLSHVPQERVAFNRWYASTPFRRDGGDGFWMVFPSAPRSRGGLVSPAGPDGWHVSVSGSTDDVPPTSGAEVLAYAATLEDPLIAERLTGCEPMGATHLFRRPTAIRNRYDLVEPITGLIAIGDAAVTLNPLLGLGIASAAWQAAVLDEVLARHDAAPLRDLPVPYGPAAAAVESLSWELSLCTEHPLVEAVAALDPAPVEAIRSAVVELIWDDVDVQRRDSEMWHLLRPYTDLQAPDLIARVRDRLTRPGRASSADPVRS